MKLFDLHCDTIYRSVVENKSILNGNLCVTVKKLKKIDEYTGCFAAWIPDNIRGDDAYDLFNKINLEFVNIKKKYFNSSLSKKIFLTVESGAVLGGDLTKIKDLAEKGVRILTLTWNGECEIGDGANVENPKGLTEFGAKAVKELERNNIIIDISHASEKLFYDLCEIAEKPFIATHSNSKKICGHQRNLTDDQFKIICKNGGLTGINFCNDFLKISGNAGIEDIFRHIENFLSLSGENIVCIGSDFDGADVLEEIKDVSETEKLYNFLLRKNYSEKLVKKIFFDNAYNFFKFIKD
jgi:membrane dipeptidase